MDCIEEDSDEEEEEVLEEEEISEGELCSLCGFPEHSSDEESVITGNTNEITGDHVRVLGQSNILNSRTLFSYEDALDRYERDRTLRGEPEEDEELIPIPPEDLPALMVPVGEDEPGVGEDVCVICFDKAIKMRFNCGHACACIGCTKKMCEKAGLLCPLCRAKVTLITGVKDAECKD
jgi:hypothetical protein